MSSIPAVSNKLQMHSAGKADLNRTVLTEVVCAGLFVCRNYSGSFNGIGNYGRTTEKPLVVINDESVVRGIDQHGVFCKYQIFAKGKITLYGQVMTVFQGVSDKKAYSDPFFSNRASMPLLTRAAYTSP